MPGDDKVLGHHYAQDKVRYSEDSWIVIFPEYTSP